MVVEASTMEIQAWKPELDATNDGLKLQVGKINKHLECVVLGHSSASLGVLENPMMTSVIFSASDTAIGPDGHRVDNTHRETGLGPITTHPHLPIKGMPDLPSNRLFGYHPEHHVGHPSNHSSNSSHRHPGKLPKISFLLFDGDSPQL